MSAKNKDDFILDQLRDLKDAVEKGSEKTSEMAEVIAAHRASLEYQAKRDEQMYEEFKRMNDILQANTDSLREHMMRTSLLEDAVVKIDNRLSPIEVESIQRAAIKEYWKNLVLLSAKVAGGLSALAAVIAGIMKWLH